MKTCIERRYLGGTEQVNFDEFAEYVIGDYDEAFEICNKMLESNLTYAFNAPDTGAKPEYYEEFDIIDETELRKQMRHASRNSAVD